MKTFTEDQVRAALRWVMSGSDRERVMESLELDCDWKLELDGSYRAEPWHLEHLADGGIKVTLRLDKFERSVRIPKLVLP